MGAHLGCQKEGEREPVNKILLENLKKYKKDPKVLKILKFRGNKIDQDCKIVNSNSEKQQNTL